MNILKKTFRRFRIARPTNVDPVMQRRAEIKRYAEGPHRRIVIGSAGIAQPGWLATDIDDLNLLIPSTWHVYFSAGSIDAMLAEHVWEHLTAEQGIVALQTCFEFLKPGGYLRIAVPDGKHPDPDYINAVRPGGTGLGADDHQLLYDFGSLASACKSVGFEVQPLEYFDGSGKFVFNQWNPNDGLVRRSKRFDPRNQDGSLTYTSVILDAIKPHRSQFS